MPLNFQSLPMSFSGGMDTFTSPKQVQPANLLYSENAVFANDKEISKRWGYEALPTTYYQFNGTNDAYTVGTISSACSITTYNNELIMFDGYSMYSYSPTDDAWIFKGLAQNLTITSMPLISNNYFQSNIDSSELNNIRLSAWNDSRGNIRYSIQDTNNNAYIVADTLLTTSVSNPKIIVCPSWNQLVLLYINSSGNINFQYINTNTNFTLNSASLNTLEQYDGYKAYDAHFNDGYLYVSYYGGVSARTNQLCVVALNSNHTISYTLNYSTNVVASTFCPTLTHDGYNNIWCAYTASTSLSIDMSVWNYSLNSKLNTYNSIASPISSATAISYPSYGNGILLAVEAIGSDTYDPSDAYWFNSITVYKFQNGISTGTQVAQILGAGLASKAFTVNNNYYFNAVYMSYNQYVSTYFTLQLVPTTVNGQGLSAVGKFQFTNAGTVVQLQNYMLPECYPISTNPSIFKFANQIQGNTISVDGSLQSVLNAGITQLDFSTNCQFNSQQFSDGLYIMGGITKSYDGFNLTEHNFNYYPDEYRCTISTTGGNIGITGQTTTYQWIVFYTYTDNNGTIQWSSPSVAITQIFVNNDTNLVQFTGENYRITDKTNVEVVIFRTLANGSLFYQITSPLNQVASLAYTNTWIYTDTASDASIQTNALSTWQPNTTGADPVLNNSAPPAGKYIVEYNNRLFIAGIENDPNQVWYSQQKIVGVPAEFSADLTLELPVEDGPITGLASFNGQLIIFKEKQIFYISGQGPTENGDGNDLLSFIPIQAPGVGCSSNASIISTNQGLFFQSLQGIYLIDLGLNVTRIGQPMQLYNNLTTTSSTIIAPQWIVWNTTGQSNDLYANYSPALVYDYVHNAWGIFTNHQGVAATSWTGNNNLYCYLRPNGQVMVQTTYQYPNNDGYDGYTGFWQQDIDYIHSGFYKLRVKTAHLALANIQGYQRVQHFNVLGSYIGPSTILFSVEYNYSGSNQTFSQFQPNSIINSQAYGNENPYGTNPSYSYGNGGTVQGFQFTVMLTTQKCEALSITIEDVQTGSLQPYNGSFNLDSITFKVGMKSGPYKLPSTNQINNS